MSNDLPVAFDTESSLPHSSDAFLMHMSAPSTHNLDPQEALESLANVDSFLSFNGRQQDLILGDGEAADKCRNDPIDSGRPLLHQPVFHADHLRGSFAPGAPLDFNLHFHLNRIANVSLASELKAASMVAVQSFVQDLTALTHEHERTACLFDDGRALLPSYLPTLNAMTFASFLPPPSGEGTRASAVVRQPGQKRRAEDKHVNYVLDVHRVIPGRASNKRRRTKEFKNNGLQLCSPIISSSPNFPVGVYLRVMGLRILRPRDELPVWARTVKHRTSHPNSHLVLEACGVFVQIVVGLVDQQEPAGAANTPVILRLAHDNVANGVMLLPIADLHQPVMQRKWDVENLKHTGFAKTDEQNNVWVSSTFLCSPTASEVVYEIALQVELMQSWTPSSSSD